MDHYQSKVKEVKEPIQNERKRRISQPNKSNPVPSKKAKLSQKNVRFQDNLDINLELVPQLTTTPRKTKQKSRQTEISASSSGKTQFTRKKNMKTNKM